MEPNRFFGITSGHLIIVSTLLYALVIAVFFARRFYLAEMASNFPIHYAIGLLVTTVLFFVLRQNLWAVLNIAFIGIALLPVYSAYTSVMRQQSSEYQDFSILQFNVYCRNHDFNKLEKYLESMASLPDLIILQEFTHDADEAIANIKQQYGYKITTPETGAYGYAILSKNAFTHERAMFDIPGHGYNRVKITLPKFASELVLYEVHTISPISSRDIGRRNHQLEVIARMVKESGEKNVMVAGDLNITPFSTYYKSFEQESGLVNSMRFGFKLGTWPSAAPSFLRIPLDHLLVTPNISVVSREVISSLGSDHLPVLHAIRIHR